MSQPENGPFIPAIRWPVPKNNRGGEFSNLEEMLAHLEGEATGHWLIGRNGMWHGGIHITDTTTPWCALSGQAMNEAVDFPVPFKGEQAVRCMADGEVVAYRINRDYLSVPWYWGDLHYSGSFVLVRHRIQPGSTSESGLTFYTLYMHLAPWLAYPEQDSAAFKVADGQHLKAYVDTSRQWVAAELPPGTRVTWDKAVHADTLTGANGRQYAHVTLEEPVTGNMSLNAGDRVWTVCDRGNLIPARDSATRPAWWSPSLPPSSETLLFDTVVCPTPYPIKAGDPVGHMGYFQVPTEDGHEKRYQVHIECLTTDDLPRFLSNPEGVGRDTPAFARCPKDIPVYLQFNSGEVQKGLIITQTETVMALSGQAVTDKEGKRYWPDGSSRGLLAEWDLQLLSRYDLAGRGFETTEDSPASFDHLDGKTQPKGLVKKIFERFFNVADNDGQPYSKAEAFNYRQLLDKIDDGKSTWYNAEQYRRAVQNQSMRDHLNSLCAKHPSDWYYSSETPVWKAFFTPQLKKEAPEWYAYSMKFLTDIRWMYRVAGMVENPWHMHPLMFLDAIKSQVKTLEGKLTYNAEGNDISSSIYYSRVIHWPGNDLSGVTLGRGYDMGDRSESDVYNDMVTSGISDEQAAKISKGAGLKGSAARDFVALNKAKIGEIALQQQETLFSITYPKYIDRTIVNYNKWTTGVSGVKPWDALDAQIQEVLVDFVYQGFTKGPKPMLAGSNNSKKELIGYIRNTPAISQYEPGRHRADYLEGEK
ncbi:pesticin C-terminus-like muramidase [Lelliottia amnigena]|uniref:Pesticin C-terminus-like muramidase n=1 Tax=Lelliottia amnigena TaxID=61646 RepID=A0ABU7UDZ7_LELAM